MRSSTRARRAVAAFAASALLLAGTLASAPAAGAAPATAQVVRMAALGDSISQAAMTCSSLTSCPANSWSTGSSTTVNSHFLRLRALGATGLAAYNLSTSGAASASLPAQAQAAATQTVQYVTIEVGANDACTRTVDAMTPTAAFAANVTAALTTLAASPGSPEIFVASIPSLQRLYELNRSSLSARLAWGLLQTCRSMLANPSSTAAADVQRRAAVQQRVNEYNQALSDACAATAKCRFDGFAVADYAFARSDLSTRDYFHPSLSGQANLAAITWPKTQWMVP
ncbi:GDSL-type esterase/lipase family protein [Microbacterium sp. NPDC056736]|uniref:GDSL-type esterase/lipase family protein n=1 Tax=Microbacterium sp. NPDC056736 TaxID=3345932 RepID=UPI00366D7F78